MRLLQAGPVAGMVFALLFPGPARVALAETDASAAFAALEARLLDAAAVEVEFDISAVGAFEAALQGQATIVGTGHSSLAAQGTFGGAAADLHLAARDGSMNGGNGPNAFEIETPSRLSEGLLVGLTRMGLLHNLAMLSAGSPPDRTDGGVREWVTVEDLALEDAAPIGGAEMQAFSFSIIVGGQPSGVARLWVDARTGLPVRRTQTVSFPDGEMRVLEQYSAFRLIESP